MPRAERASPAVCFACALLATACSSSDAGPSGGGAGGSAGSAAGSSGASTAAGSGAADRDPRSSGAGVGGAGETGSAGSAGTGVLIGQAGAPVDAGAAGSDDTTSAEPGYCPGVSLPQYLALLKTCTDDAQCRAASPTSACLLMAPGLCGGIAPMPECGGDAACGPGRVCRLLGCGDAECVDGCELLGCASSQRCESGRCVEKACDDPDAAPCADSFVCDPASTDADARGCRALSCHGGGYECPLGWDCGADGTDAHGCMHRRCQTAADCDCGSCILGFCEPHPGACFDTTQPP